MSRTTPTNRELPNIDQLSDDALLALWARASLNFMLCRLLTKTVPSREVTVFVKELNREISARRLDQRP